MITAASWTLTHRELEGPEEDTAGKGPEGYEQEGTQLQLNPVSDALIPTTSRFSLRMTFVTVPSYLKTIWAAEARTGDSVILGNYC